MTEEENLEFERQKFEFEKQKLELELRQFEFEKLKASQSNPSFSNPNVKRQGISGLTSFFHQYKISILLFAVALAGIGGYYGIQWASSESGNKAADEYCNCDKIYEDNPNSANSCKQQVIQKYAGKLNTKEEQIFIGIIQMHDRKTVNVYNNYNNSRPRSEWEKSWDATENSMKYTH